MELMYATLIRGNTHLLLRTRLGLSQGGRRSCGVYRSLFGRSSFLWMTVLTPKIKGTKSADMPQQNLTFG